MIIHNLFIAFTKAQLIHIENIIATEKLSNVIIVTRYNVSSGLNRNSEQVFVLSGSIFKIRTIWLELERKLGALSSFNLFIAHSFNIFTQGMQHSLLRSNKLNSLNIFPDGNLLFNNFSVSRNNLSHIYRKILSLFIHCTYKPFQGSIISPFIRIDTVFSYLPGVICEHQQLKLINMPKIKLNSENDTLLILGHRNQKAIAADILLDIIISNNTSEKIYFKPHPRLSLGEDLFYKILKGYFKDKLEVINDDSPIESIIEKYPAGEVFAVASSSLITLKILAPHVRVNYFGLKEYLGKHYDPLIKKQFEDLDLNEWD